VASCAPAATTAEIANATATPAEASMRTRTSQKATKPIIPASIPRISIRTEAAPRWR
jgi:hypothetical protein